MNPAKGTRRRERAGIVELSSRRVLRNGCKPVAGPARVEEGGRQERRLNLPTPQIIVENTEGC
jgi:hypothetical protein